MLAKNPSYICRAAVVRFKISCVSFCGQRHEWKFIVECPVWKKHWLNECLDVSSELLQKVYHNQRQLPKTLIWKKKKQQQQEKVN